MLTRILATIHNVSILHITGTQRTLQAQVLQDDQSLDTSSALPPNQGRALWTSVLALQSSMGYYEHVLFCIMGACESWFIQMQIHPAQDRSVRICAFDCQGVSLCLFNEQSSGVFDSGWPDRIMDVLLRNINKASLWLLGQGAPRVTRLPGVFDGVNSTGLQDSCGLMGLQR